MIAPYSALAAAGIEVDIRPATPADAVDGVLPGAVLAPASPRAVADVLAWLSTQHLAVLIRGGGTKLGWGRPAAAVDAVLDMRRLDAIVSHARGDLTATVEAGLPLGQLNAALGAAGQWLPVDPPFRGAATIGGLLATNDSGPHRHRFGTPRDLVIGVELATSDGRLAKAGGQVVKNVAGYDLSKLLSGSFGQLAAIVSATFKLAPLPAASKTLLIERLDADAAAEVVQRVSATQLEPVAFELKTAYGPSGAGGAACLVRFASVAAAVDAQLSAARAQLAGFMVRELAGGEEAQVWDADDDRFWSRPGAVVRASWHPAETAGVLRTLESLARRAPIEAAGRAMIGSGLLRIEGDVAGQRAVIDALREGSPFGHVTIVRGPVELRRLVDVWPTVPNLPLLRSIKRSLDPGGILGAGRGPVNPEP